MFTEVKLSTPCSLLKYLEISGGEKTPKPNQENLAVLANGCSKQTSGFLGFHRVMYY